MLIRTAQLILASACLAALPAQAEVVALYDFENGGSGEDFNISGNDSSDTQLNTTASRLSTGGPEGLDGGGANNIINGTHNGSDSGPPLANWGNAGNPEGSANYAEFTITPEAGYEVTYESLSLFNGSYNGSGSIKLTYQIGAGAEVAASPVWANTGGSQQANEDIQFKSSDFADFTTSEVVTWRLYAFGNNNAESGTRIDDITINGTVGLVPEPSSLALLGLGGLLAARRRR